MSLLKLPPQFIALACLTIIFGCVSTGETQPKETPPFPAELGLPMDAEVHCNHDPNLDRAKIALWELPGVTPSDPNSAYMGNRGRMLGQISNCTTVTVTQFAWSEMDQEFWVYIETEEVEGWVSLGLIDFP